jgi:hypothetical protein
MTSHNPAHFLPGRPRCAPTCTSIWTGYRPRTPRNGGHRPLLDRGRASGADPRLVEAPLQVGSKHAPLAGDELHGRGRVRPGLELSELLQKELQVVGRFGLGEDVVCHVATVRIGVAGDGDSGVPAGNRLCRRPRSLVTFGAI